MIYSRGTDTDIFEDFTLQDRKLEHPCSRASQAPRRNSDGRALAARWLRALFADDLSVLSCHAVRG